MTEWPERRTHLENRLAELERKLHGIQDELEAPLPTDDEDRALELDDDEVLEAIGKEGQREMRAIRAALQRMDDGTYGICQSCGEKISEERLLALPAAALCRICAAATA